MTSAVDFEKILESAPDLYLILDPQLIIVAVSNAYLSATLVNKEKILGRHIFDAFPDNPKDDKATGVRNLKHSLLNVLKNKKPDTMAVQQYDIRSKENDDEFETRFWSPVNSPVFDEQNEVQYIIHRVEDVTEFIKLKNICARNAREKYLSEQDQIENEIYYRAQQIQDMNKNLQASCEQLNHTNAALEVFSRAVVHDLRNPINIIMGFSQILLNLPLNNETYPQFFDYLQEIKTAGEKMEGLISGLSILSRVTSKDLRRSTINVSLLAKSIFRSIRTLEPTRQIDFIVAKDIIVDDADVDLVKIALENLLMNAWKYTARQSNARIELGEYFNDANTSKQLFLKDNGVGFLAERAGRLFQVFGRLHSDSEFPGTGIGLAIVKRVMERHGGSVWAEAEVNQGATFHLQFQK